MGEACLATSTPKRTEIEHLSKQSRGEGGRDEKAAIPTRTRRHFSIVCADFCYLSKHTESQVHTSKIKRHKLTGTGRPAGTTQKISLREDAWRPNYRWRASRDSAEPRLSVEDPGSGVRCATRCQDAATAGTARSDRCFDSNASRTRGGRRLCRWRRWLSQNEHCRKRRNGQCRWTRARISARSRNQSRDSFACNEKSLKVFNLIQAISLAAGSVHRYVGREADPSSPGVSRPVIIFLLSLLSRGPPPPSNWS